MSGLVKINSACLWPQFMHLGLAVDLSCARPQTGLEAEVAPTQESGLRENCTSRLSERAEAGRNPTSPDSTGGSRRTKPGKRPRSRWSWAEAEGNASQRSTAAGRRTGKVCHGRWSAYDKPQGNGRRNGSPHSSTISARTTPAVVSRPQARCCTGRGWADMARLRRTGMLGSRIKS
jgi:hypothetical protein